MRIQVNSDNSIAVDASLKRFVRGKVNRVLARFAKRLTRVDVHLSDVDKRKTGQADKRCLIEVRAAGARPLSASAKATKMASAIVLALGKMQRLLTTFLGRRGRPAATVSGSVSTAMRTTLGAKRKAAVKKSSIKKPTALSPRRPTKKRGTYRARRKSWSTR